MSASFWMTEPPLRDLGDTEKKPCRIEVAVGVVVVAVVAAAVELPAAAAAAAAVPSFEYRIASFSLMYCGRKIYFVKRQLVRL